MPASRAASALPPTANVRRPKVVRLSSTQPATETSANIQTSIGTPSDVGGEERREAGSVDDLGAPVRDDLGQAAGAASIARVAMKATSFP